MKIDAKYLLINKSDKQVIVKQISDGMLGRVFGHDSFMIIVTYLLPFEVNLNALKILSETNATFVWQN